jgi:hypothetical protein
MTPFDRLLARRTLALGAILTLLVVGVVVVTDEAGSTFAMRVARVAALVPALAVIAEMVALAQCRERGEERALLALGASPRRVAFGAIVGGMVLALAALVLVASPLSDVSSLFPVVASSSAWSATPAGLLDPSSGVSVAASGAITLSDASVVPALAGAPTRAAALSCFTPLALVAPLWGATELGLAARLSGAALAFAAAVVLLHVVAAGRAPASILVLAALPLVPQLFVVKRSRA